MKRKTPGGCQRHGRRASVGSALRLKTFSRAGFEWTYEGDGPRQLAMAILADHFGDDQKAIQQCEQFMVDVVANLDNYWELTSEQIEKFVNGQG